MATIAQQRPFVMSGAGWSTTSKAAGGMGLPSDVEPPEDPDVPVVMHHGGGFGVWHGFVAASAGAAGRRGVATAAATSITIRRIERRIDTTFRSRVLEPVTSPDRLAPPSMEVQPVRTNERRVSGIRAASALGGALLAVTGVSCGGAEPEPTPSPTATASPSPTPTATAIPSPTALAVDPAVIPDEEAITVEYVQAVIDALDEQLGEVARVAVTEGVESEAVAAGLSRVYSGAAHASARTGWRDYLGPLFGEEPEGPDTTVTELVTATRTCVSVRADRSLDAYGPEVEFSGSGWFLAFEPSGEDPGPANPTAWRITFEGIPSDDSVEVADPCAG